MLEKAENVILISEVESFADTYKGLAEDIGVELKVVSEWKPIYRVNADVVILGSKHLDKLNSAYYNKVVLILKEDESPLPFVKKGISRFIYNFRNTYELAMALYCTKQIEKNGKSEKNDLYNKTLSECADQIFCLGKYEFDFIRDVFKYKQKEIYLTVSEKNYLAMWLLKHEKPVEKRIHLFNMRKKFGKDFLCDINKYGTLRRGGKKVEQFSKKAS